MGYSERRGIEIEGGIKINNKWDWSGNVSMSQNTIASYTEYVDNWDTWGQESVNYQNTDIAFSPELIWASKLDYQLNKNIELQLISKYVGEQFIDNTSSKIDSWMLILFTMVVPSGILKVTYLNSLN